MRGYSNKSAHKILDKSSAKYDDTAMNFIKQTIRLII